MKFCCKKSSNKRSQYNPPHKRSTHDKHPYPDFSAPAGKYRGSLSRTRPHSAQAKQSKTHNHLCARPPKLFGRINPGPVTVIQMPTTAGANVRTGRRPARHHDNLCSAAAGCRPSSGATPCRPAADDGPAGMALLRTRRAPSSFPFQSCCCSGSEAELRAEDGSDR